MSYRQPGTVLTDHVFALPLDHRRPDGEQIEVFAREVVAADKAEAQLPWLLFLTRWSAQRIRAEFAGFDPGPALDGDGCLLFTGEMIYPWTIDADPVLRPLREAADLLAERDDWPALYDPTRLAANEVPVVAAVYYDDMYVDRELSMRTAQAICGMRTWVTSEYEHDGLRVSSGAVLDRLIGMCRGTA